MLTMQDSGKPVKDQQICPSDAHIRKLMQKEPKALYSNVEKQ